MFKYIKTYKGRLSFFIWGSMKSQTARALYEHLIEGVWNRFDVRTGALVRRKSKPTKVVSPVTACVTTPVDACAAKSPELSAPVVESPKEHRCVPPMPEPWSKVVTYKRIKKERYYF